jgi:hypothetical protein
MANNITLEALKASFTEFGITVIDNPTFQNFASSYDCDGTYDAHIMEREYGWMVKAAFKKASELLKTPISATEYYDGGELHELLAQGTSTHSNGYVGNLHETSHEDVVLQEHQLEGFTFFYIPNVNEDGIIVAPTEFFNLLK